MHSPLIMSTWRYAQNGQTLGPIETPALVELLRSGALPAETLVWTGGMAAWASASTIPELGGTVPATGAPPLPPRLDAAPLQRTDHVVHFRRAHHEVPRDRGLPATRGLEVDRRRDAHRRRDLVAAVANRLPSRHAHLIDAAVDLAGDAERTRNGCRVEFNTRWRRGCRRRAEWRAALAQRRANGLSIFTASPCPAMCMYITRGDSWST